MKRNTQCVSFLKKYPCEVPHHCVVLPLMHVLCFYKPYFNCWVDILCGKIHWIVSLGGWLAAEAVLLHTLCSIAWWTFYAVKYTGFYRWVGGWQLRLRFYKPYVQLPGGHFIL